jgi:maltooligosyltrehalose trehalohydrolase
MTLSKRLGAVYLGDNRCSFRIWAPKAARVDVRLLAPDERLLPLTKAGDTFSGLFDHIPPGSLYLYRLNGETERPDPASCCQPQGVHGPSQVVSLDFPWEDQSWIGLPLRDYVIYEVHVGTYTPEGTFEAIIPRLPQLRDLGVTALELMPVAQFPGERNWGYDGVYPYAVQNSYGGLQGLQRLVNACHKQSLAVILDVVYNHLGPEGNYLADFGPFFTAQYRTPWGEAINFDQADGDQVREFFINNALYWITEYHIDALRLDALHAVVDTSARPFLAELAQAVKEQAGRLGRRVFLMAESDINDVKHLRPREVHGFGLESHWLDDFHHALHTLLTGEDDGYYSDFGSLDHLAKAYQEGFVYSGQYSRFRRRRHGSSACEIRPYRFIAFAQNHDQVGNRLLGERLSRLTSLAGLKLAAAAVILSPFTPLLFMGEEYGETAPFYYFISHGDTELIVAVRQGRVQEFADFGWKDNPLDPQSTATFQYSHPQAALFQKEPHQSLWHYYQELLKIRREMLEAVNLGGYYPLVAVLQEQSVITLQYDHGDQQYCVLLSFSEQPEVVTLPPGPGAWRLRLNAAASRWAGLGDAIPETFDPLTESALTLPAISCVVFSREKEKT